MGLLDMLAPIINLLMLITYAVYVLFGLLICVIGVAYISEISGADKTAAGVCIACGFFMMLVGAAAVFATLKKNWLIMAVVLLVDVALFCALLAACMVGFVVANEVRDPVKKGVDEAFATILLKQNGWDGVKETFAHGGPERCKEFSKLLGETANKKIISDAKKDEKYYAGNCTAVHVKIDHATASVCEHCWLDFKSYTITKIKDHLWPATYTVGSLFLFVVISICLNIFMIDNCDPDEEDDDEDAADKWLPQGMTKMASLILTGIVGLFGLLLTIFGAVAYNELSGNDCPANTDCTNWAVVGIIVLGLFFFLLAGLNVAAVMLGGFIGKNIMRILTLVWVVLAFVLLICGICFALVAGAITSINEQYDLNFEKVREQANQADDTICPTSMKTAECKAKIKKKTEDAFEMISIVLGIACAGFVFVMYVTLQAVKIFKADEGDDDEDGDE